MKAELLLDEPLEPNALGVNTTGFPLWKPNPAYVVAPKGTVLEGPNVWIFVQIGKCKPVDQDCRDKAGMTDDEIVQAYRSYVKLRKGQLTGDPRFDAPDTSKLLPGENKSSVRQGGVPAGVPS